MNCSGHSRIDWFSSIIFEMRSSNDFLSIRISLLILAGNTVKEEQELGQLLTTAGGLVLLIKRELFTGYRVI